MRDQIFTKKIFTLAKMHYVDQKNKESLSNLSE